MNSPYQALAAFAICAALLVAYGLIKTRIARSAANKVEEASISVLHKTAVVAITEMQHLLADEAEDLATRQQAYAANQKRVQAAQSAIAVLAMPAPVSQT